MKKIFKVIIAGSRNFNDYDLLKSVCDELLSLKIHSHEIVIISGTAYGADKLGEQYADEYGFKVERYPADWGTYGKSAGYRRNEEMAKIADALIAFWDGESKGTMHMINLAERYNLQVHVEKYG